jgi:predicted DNA-binding protein
MASSTVLRVRINDEMESELRRFAQGEGTTVSQIVRDAIDTYLADEEAHIRRVSGTRAQPAKKREDKALPRHSPGLRMDIFEE